MRRGWDRRGSLYSAAKFVRADFDDDMETKGQEVVDDKKEAEG